jgi:hypothetical protein
MILNDRNYLYAQEALLFIQNEMSQNSLSNSIENNKIKIAKVDGKQKEIYLSLRSPDSSDIVITHIQYGFASTTNNVLRNIKDFKFIKKGKVMYIYILTMDGKKFERCLPLNP